MEKIKFLWNACPIPGCFSIVDGLNLLTEQVNENKIQFTWVDHAESPEVFSGDHNRLFRHGGCAQVISAIANGASLKVVGIDINQGSSGIAVRFDSPIKSVDQLRGKRVLVPKGVYHKGNLIVSQPYLSLLQCLEATGLNEKELEIINLTGTPEKLPESIKEAQVKFAAETHPAYKALLSGDVDAIQTSSHQAGRMIVDGRLRMLIDTRDHPGLRSVQITTVSDEVIEKYPDMIIQFIIAHLKAARWGRLHKEELITMMAQNSGVSQDAIVRSHTYDFHMHLAPEFTEKNIDALEHAEELLYRRKLIPVMFNMRSMLESTFLEKALGILDGS